MGEMNGKGNCPATLQQLSDDFTENSFKKVHASVQTADQHLGADDPKCSSETLRAIMLEASVCM